MIDIFRSVQSAYDKIWKMLCGVYDTDSLAQEVSNPVWKKDSNKCIRSVSASSLLRFWLLDALQLHGSNSMTQQPLKLTIEYIYRHNSIYT